MNGHLDQYLKNFSEPHPNADGIREDPQLSKLFETKVPISVPGFELEEHDRDMMSTVWPAGEDSARQVCVLASLDMAIDSDPCRFWTGFYTPSPALHRWALSIRSLMEQKSQRREAAS